MKYEKIIIAIILCATAIVCCNIIAGRDRWQYVQLKNGLIIFDKNSGISYRAGGDNVNRVEYVRQEREL